MNDPIHRESLPLLPEEIELLRQRLHQQRPRLGDPALERFAQQLFADDLIVEAYFHPREQGRGADVGANAAAARRQVPRLLIPFELASAAAQQAQRAPLLLPHERPLASVATLVYPSGLFLGALLSQSPSAARPTDANLSKAMTRLLVEDALHQLRGQHHGLADTLGAVLGLGDDGDCQPKQVARIASAVVLASLPVTELWGAGQRS